MLKLALRKTHIAISQAAILGYAIALHQPVLEIIPEVIGGWWGCQLPDIDQKQTRINRAGGVFTNILTWGGHRTWTHSVWVPILLFIIAIRWTNNHTMNGVMVNGVPVMGYFYFAFAAGYFLHELEDSFSFGGVKWLYPFNRKKSTYKQGVLRYKVGGTKEKVMFIMAITIIIAEITWILYTYMTGITH